MSSSMSAIRDDENAWAAFCEKTGADSRWTLYSPEYYNALDIHKLHGYTHRELRLAVQHEKQRVELARVQLYEWQELKHLIDLEKKYQ